MEIVLIILAPVSAAAIIGAGGWLIREQLGWFKTKNSETPKGESRAVNETQTSKSPTTADRGGVAIGVGNQGDVTVVHQEPDHRFKERVGTVEKQLAEFQKRSEFAGTNEAVATAELARAADPDAKAGLQEALQLQAQDKNREAIDCLNEAFHRDLEPAAAIQLRLLLGKSYMSLSEFSQAEGQFRRALDFSRSSGDERSEAAALGHIGSVCLDTGELQAAEEHHSNALQIYKKLGDRSGEAASLGNLGNVYYSRGGDTARAIEYHRRSLEISRDLDDAAGEASSLTNLGRLYTKEHEFKLADELLKNALTIHKRIGNRIGQAIDLNNLGLLRKSEDDLEGAEEFYDEGLSLAKRTGHRLGEASILGNLGIIYRYQGNTRRASETHDKVLAIYRAIAYPDGEAQALIDIALSKVEEHDLEPPCRLLKQALEIYERIGATGGA